MTDNEIIKALPTVAYGGHSCNKCKYKHEKGECRCGLKGCRITRNALDLINRQKAEIEELRKGFTADADYFASEYDSKIKAEAIKEFAERLKENMQWCDIMTTATHAIIDNLVKEMVGDE